MDFVDPNLFLISRLFAAVVALSVVLSSIISWLYRDRPEKVINTWLKLGILLGLILIFILTASLGKWTFLPVALFLAYRGWLELVRCVEAKYGEIQSFSLIILLGTLGILGGLEPSGVTTFITMAIAAWLALIIPLLIYREPVAMHGVLSTAFGIIFVTMPVALLLNLLANDYGEFSFLVLLVMNNDGFSQGSGLLGGKKLLIPQISPGKTWIGAAGGLLSCLIVGYLLRFLVLDWQVWQAILVAGIISLSSLCGDLIASSLKREADIKDFGRVLGATGGILDKFDSLLFAVPVFYFIASYLK